MACFSHVANANERRLRFEDLSLSLSIFLWSVGTRRIKKEWGVGPNWRLLARRRCLPAWGGGGQPRPKGHVKPFNIITWRALLLMVRRFHARDWRLGMVFGCPFEFG